MTTQTQTTAAIVASDLAATVEKLQQVTVQVRGRGPGGGSGVLWAPGLVITNAHVARGPQATIELTDGRTFEATVTGWDPQRDLAALAFDAPADLPVATIGDSDKPRTGELVIAVGNPLAQVGAATLGVIHVAPQAGRLVQADIRLAPGNSGGPLADAQGRVIGVNSMISGGLGLAVPANIVVDFTQSLQPQPVLGIEIHPIAITAGGVSGPGLVIVGIAADSAAEVAGLLQGDIVIGAGGQRFERAGDLIRALRDAGAGGSLALDIVRGGQPVTVPVALAPLTSGSVAA